MCDLSKVGIFQEALVRSPSFQERVTILTWQESTCRKPLRTQFAVISLLIPSAIAVPPVFMRVCVLEENYAVIFADKFAVPRLNSVNQRILRSHRPSVKDDAQLLVVIIVLDEEAADGFGGFENALVALVPLGGDFVEKESALIGEA